MIIIIIPQFTESKCSKYLCGVGSVDKPVELDSDEYKQHPLTLMTIKPPLTIELSWLIDDDDDDEEAEAECRIAW